MVFDSGDHCMRNSLDDSQAVTESGTCEQTSKLLTAEIRVMRFDKIEWGLGADMFGNVGKEKVYEDCSSRGCKE